MRPGRPDLRALLVPLVLAACVHPPAGGEGPSGDTGFEELVDVEGCADDPDFFSDISAALTEQSTVLEVSWSTAEEARSYVVVAEDDGVDETLRSGSTARGPDTEHDILVRGLHANTAVHFKLAAQVGEELVCSDERVVETGGLPASLPTFERTDGTGQGTEGYTLAPVITAQGSFASIFDSNGRLVWAWEREDTIWRTAMARAGDGILVNMHASSLYTKGAVSHVAFDGTVTELAAVRAAHTDFVELPDGNLAVLGWVVQEFEHEGETRSILGDTVLEVDGEGRVREVWNVFDHFTPDLEQRWEDTMNVAEGVEDWSHANGFSYNEATDSYLVSVSGLHTVVAIDRVSGAQLWSLGEEGEDFATESMAVHWPHSVYAMSDDRVLVFNRNDYEAQECSEVVIFELDRVAGTAEEVLTYGGQDCLSVYFLGEARPLPDGGVQVIWTTSGRIDHIDADGTLRWSLQSALGAGIGFSDFTQTLYPSEAVSL